MAYSTEPSIISFPITTKARQIAQQFAGEQPTSEKSAQIFCNTLAVLLVYDYLQLLDISTELEASYSWNSIGRLCANVADLKITGIGHLECRPVQAGETNCQIRPEVWSDRIGYVVVQLDEANREGTLLGFVPSVSSSTIPIAQLQPLEKLLDRLGALTINSVHLSEWFESIFQVGWQAIEEVINPQKVNYTWAFRMKTTQPESSANVSHLIEQVYLAPTEEQRKIAAARLADINEPNPEVIAALVHLINTTTDEETRWTAAESLWKIDPNHPTAGAKRIRDWGMQLAGHAVGLMVAILPKSDLEIAILLRVYPLASQLYLPESLQLIVVDEFDAPLLETQARKKDNYIQLKFSGQRGERFSAKLVLNEAIIAENFII